MIELMVYDEITPKAWADAGFGISANMVADVLNDNPNDEILMRVNSPGGTVWEGLAIYESIKQHGNVTYQIDGVALSVASWMGLGANEITVGEFGYMMVHPPMMWADAFAFGDSNDLRKLATELQRDANRLDKTGDKIASMYAKHTGQSTEQWQTAMKDETWYDGDEAVKVGLANRIIEQTAAVNCVVDFGRYPKNVADNLRATLNRAPSALRNRIRDGENKSGGLSWIREPAKDAERMKAAANIRRTVHNIRRDLVG